MKELTIKGFNVRVTRYKLIIYEESESEVSSKDAKLIAQYLFEEGFIKKDSFPVEIISIEE